MIKLESIGHDYLRILKSQTYKKLQVGSVRKASDRNPRVPQFYSHR